MKSHAKKCIRVNRDGLKSWMVGSLMARQSIPGNVFGSEKFSLLFWMRNLGDMFANIAKRCTDGEVV